MVWFITLTVLIISFFCSQYIFYNNWRKLKTELVIKDRRILELDQAHREYEQKKEEEGTSLKKDVNLLKGELERKNRELAVQAFEIVQTNEVLYEIAERLQKVNAPAINNILKEVKVYESHKKDWAQFKERITAVNPFFYENLVMIYHLSDYEVRLCTLILFNVDSAMAVGILNISKKGLETAKYRLKKKLGLKADEDLYDFIVSLAKPSPKQKAIHIKYSNKKQ